MVHSIRNSLGKAATHKHTNTDTFFRPERVRGFVSWLARLNWPE